MRCGAVKLKRSEAFSLNISPAGLTGYGAVETERALRMVMLIVRKMGGRNGSKGLNEG
jgi:hypothetical protein